MRLGQPSTENLTHGAPSRRPSNHRPDPDPGGRADRRLRPLRRQARRSATASTSTRPSSRTGTTRSAGAVRVRGARRAQLARGAAARRSATTAGAARSPSTGRAAGSSPSPRGPIASRPGRTSCAARSTPARTDLAGELAEGAVLLGRESRDRRGGARRRRGRPPRRGRPRSRSRSTSTACSRASAPGTSSSRARGAASAASRTCCRSSRELGFDVVYLPPIHPIGHDEPQGPEQRADARAGRRRLAVGDRRGGGRSRRDPPGSRHVGRLRRDGRRGEAQPAIEIALDFAIQCSPDHPWLKEHPEWFNRRPDGTLKYAENPPKRYQDIYNVNFESRGLARALAGAPRRRARLGRARRHRLPRRQPAHEAGCVLGVADPRGARDASRGDLPRRGVHAARR